MTNWMETIIFLLQMGELRMVGDCLCLCPSIYTVHGSQSVRVSGLIHPLPPTLGFITCAFSQGIRTLRISCECNSGLPTRLRHY